MISSVARLVMSSMTAPHPLKFNSPYHRTAAVRQTTVTARTRTVARSAQLATFSNKAVCVQVDDSRRWLVRPSLGSTDNLSARRLGSYPKEGLAVT